MFIMCAFSLIRETIPAYLKLAVIKKVCNGYTYYMEFGNFENKSIKRKSFNFLYKVSYIFFQIPYPNHPC